MLLIILKFLQLIHKWLNLLPTLSDHNKPCKVNAKTFLHISIVCHTPLIGGGPSTSPSPQIEVFAHFQKSGNSINHLQEFTQVFAKSLVFFILEQSFTVLLLMAVEAQPGFILY